MYAIRSYYVNVGGTREGLYVIETDVESNVIYTGQGNQHPGLFKKARNNFV